MRQIVVIAHDLRSAHNVGSLLRTADGLGISKVYLTGYTPYPMSPNDSRLPFLAAKISRRIEKTALGAEETVPWVHEHDIYKVMQDLKSDGFTVAALEQSEQSVKLNEYTAPEKLALLLGREVEGIQHEILDKADIAIEIPMFGKKESFNVVQAAAMALYHLRFS